MSVVDRDALLAATDIATLADELLGPRRGPGRSATWQCPSSTHAQTGRTPPVTVFRGSRGEGRWHCHGCGAGGTAVDLVVATRSLSVREAFEFLAERAWIVGEPGLAPVIPLRPAKPSPRRVTNPEGLRGYVMDCARRLFEREGRTILTWLTRDRRIPEDVLRRNLVGADAGIFLQPRPEGIPKLRSVAAVFPVLDDGEVIFAQVRLRSPPPDFARYLNPAASLAPNPKVGLYHPVEPMGRCVVVTEGPTDALSAAAAGFTAAAVFGIGLARGDDGTAARCLARLDARPVIAFDPGSGDAAAETLTMSLRSLGKSPARLHVPTGHKDLNAWMQATDDWPEVFSAALRTAIRASPSLAPPALGR